MLLNELSDVHPSPSGVPVLSRGFRLFRVSEFKRRLFVLEIKKDPSHISFLCIFSLFHDEYHQHQGVHSKEVKNTPLLLLHHSASPALLHTRFNSIYLSACDLQQAKRRRERHKISCFRCSCSPKCTRKPKLVTIDIKMSVVAP